MTTSTLDDHDSAHARAAAWALVEDARHLCVAVVLHSDGLNGMRVGELADRIEHLRSEVQTLARRCHPRTV